MVDVLMVQTKRKNKKKSSFNKLNSWFYNDKKDAKTLADKFIDNELYQMFVYDRAFILLLLIVVASVVFFIANNIFENRYFYYLLAITVITVVVFILQSRRIRKSKKLITVNTAQLVMVGVCVALILVPVALYRNAGGRWEVIFDQFLVAMWETLTFGILVPFLILLLVRYRRLNYLLEGGFFFITILLSTVGFVYAHIGVYGLDPFSMAFLFVFGYGFHFIAYAFSPSLAICLHFLNNMVVYLRVMGG